MKKGENFIKYGYCTETLLHDLTACNARKFHLKVSLKYKQHLRKVLGLLIDLEMKKGENLKNTGILPKLYYMT